MRPPICEVCDAEVDPADGLVRCAPTPASIEWHAPAARELAVGHALGEVIRTIRETDAPRRRPLPGP